MNITDVAVAVFLKTDGQFLLASRPPGKPYAGYWEFPGGKIELGESVQDALRRELIEELNVSIEQSTPWFAFIMQYAHATVRLHVWRVWAWRELSVADVNGVDGMHGMEGQEFAWQHLQQMTVTPTLPGCAPIFRALSLPPQYIISNAATLGENGYLAYLRELSAKNAPNTPPNGEFRNFRAVTVSSFPAMIQVREKQLSPTMLERFADEVVKIAHQHNSRVLINSDIELALSVRADGVHLTSSQLGMLASRPALPLVAASVHNTDELKCASALGCDFAVLGAVAATASHPGLAPLGWAKFADIVRDTPIPIYAIGGMRPADMAIAVQHGAHGIAMLRAATEKI
jgi:8-oxo-dGTP diphosphatase